MEIKFILILAISVALSLSLTTVNADNINEEEENLELKYTIEKLAIQEENEEYEKNHSLEKNSLNVAEQNNTGTNLPQWVRTTAGLWASGIISDEQYTNSLEYIIDNKLINTNLITNATATTPPEANSGTNLPTWTKNLAGLWASELIADTEYLDAIKYLIDNKMITITITTSSETTGIPDAPTLTESLKLGEITFSWNEPNDNGSKITGYEIEHLQNGKWIKCNECSDGTKTTGKLFVGNFGTTYQFRVIAINENGKSEPSNIVTVTTAPPTPTYGSISGTAPADSILSINTTPPRATTSDGTYEFTNVLHGTYTITLNNNISKQVIHSTNSIVNFEVPKTPTRIPDAPTGLTVITGVKQFTLSWNEPNDNGSKITHYIIQYRHQGTWKDCGGCTTTNTTKTFSELTGTNFVLRIIAVNSNGMSMPSETINVKLTPAPPTTSKQIEIDVCGTDDRGRGYATGRYTADDNYSSVWMTLSLLNNGIVETDTVLIQNINNGQTKSWKANTFYDGNFTSCDIVVDREREADNRFRAGSVSIDVCGTDDRGRGYATGRYTADDNYSSVWMTLSLLNNGKVVETDTVLIQNINNGQTKSWKANTFYDGNFTSCDIVVDRERE